MKLKSIFLGVFFVLSLVQLPATEPAYSAVPTVTSVTPSTGPTDSPTSVTITGADFEPGAKVSLLNGGPFLVGSLDIYAYDVYVSGNYAYLINYRTELTVVDISDPTAPVITGSIGLASTPNGVYVSGDYAYVVEGEVSDPGEEAWYAWSGLEIIDISDPAAPKLAGSIATAGAAYDVHVSGDYAYVAETASYGSSWRGLEVIDIKRPASPLIVGSYKGSVNAYAVYVSGNYAYLTIANYYGSTSGLEIIDISDPTAPTLAGSIATISSSYDVYVSGNYAYVAESQNLYSDWSGVQVIDISDPASPVVVSSFDTSIRTYKLYLVGSYLYAISKNGLIMIDVSDPTAPTLSGYYTGRGFAAVDVLNDHAYVAGYKFKVIDVKNPSYPAVAGSIKTADRIGDLYVSDDYAYLTDYQKGLHVIDVSDPTSPVPSGFFETLGTAHSLYVLGDYAYVGERSYSASLFYFGLLEVVDISDPSDPKLSGSVETPNLVSGVYVSGDYAYLGSFELEIIDVSDPYFPAIVGSGDFGGGLDVHVSGDYVYLASSELEIIDVSDRTSPALVGLFDTDNSIYIDISGDYAYAIDVWGTLMVIDISDPASPTLVGSIDIPGDGTIFLRDIYVSGDYAYIVDWLSGLHVIDIRDPALPVRAGAVKLLGETKSVHVSGDYVFTAGRGGLQVVDINDPVTDIVVVDSNTITASFPAGLPRGYYDVLVTNTAGQQQEEGYLHNGFGSGISAEPDILVTDSVLPIDDLQIPFGDVSYGNPSDQTVTITNDGDADLIIGVIAQADAIEPPFSITDDNCSNMTMAPAGSCILTIKFAPVTHGSFSDTFDIPSNDPYEDPVTISVSGSGRGESNRNCYPDK